MPNVQRDLVARIPDLLGRLLLITAVGSLALGLVRASQWGLAKRIRVGTIAAAGCLLSGVGAVLLVSSLGQSPHYVADFLPGWLLVVGISVLVAVPGTASGEAGLTVYRAAWWIAAGIVLAAAAVAVNVTPRRRLLVLRGQEPE